MTPAKKLEEIEILFNNRLPSDRTLNERWLINRLKEVTLELKSFVALWEELDGEKSAGVYLDSRRFREARSVLEGK